MKLFHLLIIFLYLFYCVVVVATAAIRSSIHSIRLKKCMFFFMWISEIFQQVNAVCHHITSNQITKPYLAQHFIRIDFFRSMCHHSEILFQSIWFVWPPALECEPKTFYVILQFDWRTDNYLASCALVSFFCILFMSFDRQRFFSSAGKCFACVKPFLISHSTERYWKREKTNQHGTLCQHLTIQ